MKMMTAGREGGEGNVNEVLGPLSNRTQGYSGVLEQSIITLFCSWLWGRGQSL